jgi:hypothetical protein
MWQVDRLEASIVQPGGCTWNAHCVWSLETLYEFLKSLGTSIFSSENIQTGSPKPHRLLDMSRYYYYHGKVVGKPRRFFPKFINLLSFFPLPSSFTVGKRSSLGIF